MGRYKSTEKQTHDDLDHPRVLERRCGQLRVNLHLLELQLEPSIGEKRRSLGVGSELRVSK